MSERIVLHEMTVLKGLAICAVVLVHMPIVLINVPFWSVVKEYIHHNAQSFMPVFMFASGFLFGISRVKISSLSDYIRLISKKFRRLMVPYFVISLILLVLKYAGGKFVNLANPVDDQFLFNMLLKPLNGFASFLWFIYVLFLIFAIFPVLQKIFRSTPVILFLLVIIYFLPFDYPYFEYNFLKRFILYFVVGYLHSYYYESLNAYSKYLFPVTMAAFIYLLLSQDAFFHLLGDAASHRYKLFAYRLITGMAEVYAAYYFALFLSKNRGSIVFNSLKTLGTYSSSIYLLHTIAMGIVLVIFVHILDISENLYPYIILIVFLLGLWLPIIMAKHVISRNSILTQLILGVKKYP